tara:strand:+ start:1142 stop:1300 length:159 start_codon:yes stop_codon:yes gene_type:complete
VPLEEHSPDIPVEVGEEEVAAVEPLPALHYCVAVAASRRPLAAHNPDIEALE